MQRLVYLVSYPFLWFIAALPFRLFYTFSDLTFVIVFYLIRYRRSVVQSNLALVFPEKGEAELKGIEKEFYRHMCDMFLETIKTMKISKQALAERYKIVNPELLRHYESRRSVLLLIPHYGNWEWSIIINDELGSKGYAVYQKIGNKYFDKLIKSIRAKWNTILIHQKEMVRTILRNQQQSVRAVYGIVSDQSPQRHRTRYWRPFMGITVPVFDMPENLAVKFDMAVVFAKISKIRRGHYQLEFQLIEEKGSESESHKITDEFLRLTEECIKDNPPYYLWTHKRWKHRDKVPPEFQKDAGS